VELSGQITISAAGTAQQGPAISGSGFFIRGLVGNAGNVYLGNDGAGDVTSSNGYELAPGDQIFIEITDLSLLYFDAENNDDGFSWLRMPGGIL